MRTRSIATATALAVVLSSAALVGGPAGPAAADSAKTLPVKSVGDVVVDGAHPVDSYPNAVRIAPDGSVAGGSDSAYGPDVHIHRPGDKVPVREAPIPNTGNSSGGDSLVDGALAWAPDSSRVFAVSVNTYGTYTLLCPD
ncbi:hypothetical protein SVIOM342S_08756 [Streptomyces violaceorubidus]